VKGLGGCPMATDKLTGNMATENVLQFLNEKNIATGIDSKQFAESMMLAGSTFPHE
jgi:hydroxymethylglutaryl-CoA lyase